MLKSFVFSIVFKALSNYSSSPLLDNIGSVRRYMCEINTDVFWARNNRGVIIFGRFNRESNFEIKSIKETVFVFGPFGLNLFLTR